MSCGWTKVERNAGTWWVKANLKVKKTDFNRTFIHYISTAHWSWMQLFLHSNCDFKHFFCNICKVLWGLDTLCDRQFQRDIQSGTSFHSHDLTECDTFNWCIQMFFIFNTFTESIALTRNTNFYLFGSEDIQLTFSPRNKCGVFRLKLNATFVHGHWCDRDNYINVGAHIKISATRDNTYGFSLPYKYPRTVQTSFGFGIPVNPITIHY